MSSLNKMGLIRLISDLNMKSISKRAINRLNNSKENEINYRGGKLMKREEGGILLEFPSGYQRIYNKEGTKCIIECFP